MSNTEQQAEPAPMMCTEGPGLPLVARLYVQGRYQRASVDPRHAGHALTFLSAAGEWRQKATLRQAMIDQLTAELDQLRAAPAHPAGDVSDEILTDDQIEDIWAAVSPFDGEVDMIEYARKIEAAVLRALRGRTA